MTCIDWDVLLKWELGDLPPGEARAIEEHLAGCARCRAANAEQKQLIEDLSPPAHEFEDDGFVASVMAACSDDPPPEPARAAWYRPYLPLVFACLAVAGAAPFVIGRLLDEAPPRALTARGAGVRSALGPRVEAFVGRTRGGDLPALLEGAEIGPGDGIVIRYSNPGERAAFLMVFALDAARDVHWLHPAYPSEDVDPSSIALAAAAERRVLDEIAEPEDPLPGPLSVYALVTDSALSVKEVEASIASSSQGIAELFPSAQVQEWRCTWRSR